MSASKELKSFLTKISDVIELHGEPEEHISTLSRWANRDFVFFFRVRSRKLACSFE
jgi:hypothetical protein